MMNPYRFCISLAGESLLLSFVKPKKKKKKKKLSTLSSLEWWPTEKNFRTLLCLSSFSVSL